MAHALSKALVQLGHSVYVCTTNLKDRREDVFGPTGGTAMVDGIEIFYEPVLLSRYWGFSPAMVRRLWSEVARADVVLIHFHYQFASLAGAWISRWHKKPYVIFTHGSLNYYGLRARKAIFKKAYLYFLERNNFHQALFSAYHSPEEMETSVRFGRCQVVPNGIDPQEFADSPPRDYFRSQYTELTDRLIFLFLGRLDAGKGLDLLLPAFKRLAAAHPEVHLVLAGGDERGYLVRVNSMVTEFELASKVTLTGLISGVDKLAAFQDADVFVLPSRSEGLSMAMLEAMYMGLPVVVTDRVGLWRQVEKNPCGLVVPYDEDSLAGALEQMAIAPDRREMGQRGRQLVAAGYTWDKIARQLVAEIEGALSV
jgi:glycosyltransferase involved in cell wall biosynthesis